eukprot:gnl/TRDRNA2_/TRDRNA2_87901_c0_seq1.p1 gnl/TRDRNA2_/TRDRNA2_87901_c0~~gnl/TRDRNA2_/TRDRNA2_87901_c0_seq1.p1  ORF type:complete len:283 (+),score=23.64 gnl/TRDRNA2_/TRDRNA2_87901_c0_seq1:73-849(+)
MPATQRPITVDLRITPSHATLKAISPKQSQQAFFRTWSSDMGNQGPEDRHRYANLKEYRERAHVQPYSQFEKTAYSAFFQGNPPGDYELNHAARMSMRPIRTKAAPFPCPRTSHQEFFRPGTTEQLRRAKGEAAGDPDGGGGGQLAGTLSGCRDWLGANSTARDALVHPYKLPIPEPAAPRPNLELGGPDVSTHYFSSRYERDFQDKNGTTLRKTLKTPPLRRCDSAPAGQARSTKDLISEFNKKTMKTDFQHNFGTK